MSSSVIVKDGVPSADALLAQVLAGMATAAAQAGQALLP